MSTLFGREHLAPAPERAEFLREDSEEWTLSKRSGVPHGGFIVLFFTAEVVREICNHTNKYAWMHIFEKLKDS